jgi:cell division inhibitor SulA
MTGLVLLPGLVQTLDVRLQSVWKALFDQNRDLCHTWVDASTTNMMTDDNIT